MSKPPGVMTHASLAETNGKTYTQSEHKLGSQPHLLATVIQVRLLYSCHQKIRLRTEFIP